MDFACRSLSQVWGGAVRGVPPASLHGLRLPRGVPPASLHGLRLPPHASSVTEKVVRRRRRNAVSVFLLGFQCERPEY